MWERRSLKYSNLGKAGDRTGDLVLQGRDLTNCDNHGRINKIKMLYLMNKLVKKRFVTIQTVFRDKSTQMIST